MQLTKSDGTTLLAAHVATFTTAPTGVGGRGTWALEIKHAGTGTPVGDVTIEGCLNAAGDCWQAITSPVAMVLDPATNTILLFAQDPNVYQYIRARWTRTSGTLTIVSANVEAW